MCPLSLRLKENQFRRAIYASQPNLPWRCRVPATVTGESSSLDKTWSSSAAAPERSLCCTLWQREHAMCTAFTATSNSCAYLSSMEVPWRRKLRNQCSRKRIPFLSLLSTSQVNERPRLRSCMTITDDRIWCLGELGF